MQFHSTVLYTTRVLLLSAACYTCVHRHPQAVTHYKDPKVVAEVSCNLGEAMVGIDCRAKEFISMANRSE